MQRAHPPPPPRKQHGNIATPSHCLTAKRNNCTLSPPPPHVNLPRTLDMRGHVWQSRRAQAPSSPFPHPHLLHCLAGTADRLLCIDNNQVLRFCISMFEVRGSHPRHPRSQSLALRAFILENDPQCWQFFLHCVGLSGVWLSETMKYRRQTELKYI